MFILDIADETKTKQEIKAILSEHGYNLLKEEDMGVKTLAYKIKKREKAFYYLLEVELPPRSLKEIDKEIRLNEKILKYMSIFLKERKGIPKHERKKKKPIKESSNNNAIDEPSDTVKEPVMVNSERSKEN